MEVARTGDGHWTPGQSGNPSATTTPSMAAGEASGRPSTSSGRPRCRRQDQPRGHHRLLRRREGRKACLATIQEACARSGRMQLPPHPPGKRASQYPRPAFLLRACVAGCLRVRSFHASRTCESPPRTPYCYWWSRSLGCSGKQALYISRSGSG
jgi:hypothetical protein